MSSIIFHDLFMLCNAITVKLYYFFFTFSGHRTSLKEYYLSAAFKFSNRQQDLWLFIMLVVVIQHRAKTNNLGQRLKKEVSRRGTKYSNKEKTSGQWQQIFVLFIKHLHYHKSLGIIKSGKGVS